MGKKKKIKIKTKMEQDDIPASQVMVESDELVTPPSSSPPATPPRQKKVEKAVRKMESVPLEEQLEVLDSERDKALTDLVLLRRCVDQGKVDVKDLNISLMPVINHQRRTNESLDRLVKRVFHHEAEKLLTSAIADIESTSVTEIVDPTGDIDEVDLVDSTQRLWENKNAVFIFCLLFCSVVVRV